MTGIPGVMAVLFEGGPVSSAIAADVTRVREAVVLDNLLKLQAVPGISRVLLDTDRPHLARHARELGAEVMESSPSAPFHLGRELQRIAALYQPEALLCLGGGAGALLSREDFAGMVADIAGARQAVLMNNVQSPDILGVTPASILLAGGLPASDNQLGQALLGLGLTRILFPNSARINFDLDTPTDVEIFSRVGGGGAFIREALRDWPWRAPALERVAGSLGTPGTELALFGRVGPTIMHFLNRHLQIRLRVYSEERGMKALGRVEAGLVTSLIGRYLDAVGPRAFFVDLARVADAALMDSRVLFAAWPGEISEADRFYSDVGATRLIRDRRVREFTAAAASAGIPVVLGGHNLVSGGLWLLGEEWVANRLPHPGAPTP